jgi:4-alpha-glucanotransferase
MIELMPLSDSLDMNFSPYSALSSFALHPIYVNLLAVSDVDLPAPIRTEIILFRNTHDRAARVDLGTIAAFKMRMLQRIFSIAKHSLPGAFFQFVEKNSRWLKGYSLFCLFRKQFAKDHREWLDYGRITQDDINILSKKFEKELQLSYWIQYVCDQQMRQSKKYAEVHRVALQTELFLAVPENSCDCWQWPGTFEFNLSLGLEPDYHYPPGYNLSCPALNWGHMKSDNHSWLSLRFSRMSDWFHAIKISDVAILFNTWHIPRNCVRGCLGKFGQAIPLTRVELDVRGLSNIERYTQPYVRWHLIVEKFNNDAAYVARRYFTPLNVDMFDDYFAFKEEFNTEQKITQRIRKEFTDEGRIRHYEICLMELLDNILLIVDPDFPDCYHVRSTPDLEHLDGKKRIFSSSWMELTLDEKDNFMQVYAEYRSRAIPIFVENGLERLRTFRNFTNLFMSIGFSSLVPIPEVQALGILPTRSQRFEATKAFDYMSICAPSTPEMLPLRAWWEEDHEKVGEIWRNEFRRGDSPWRSCEPWIVQALLEMHFMAQSMWAMFLLQDLAAVVEHMRLQKPRDERIGGLLNSEWNWSYRLPFAIESLGEDQRFLVILKKLIADSHRMLKC